MLKINTNIPYLTAARADRNERPIESGAQKTEMALSKPQRLTSAGDAQKTETAAVAGSRFGCI